MEGKEFPEADDFVTLYCECRLESLLPQYLASATAAGVALSTNIPENEGVTLEVFDAEHLIVDDFTQATALPVPVNEGPASQQQPPMKKLKTFNLKPGDGGTWSSFTSSEPVNGEIGRSASKPDTPQLNSIRARRNPTPPDPNSKAQLRKAKGLSARRRGKTSAKNNRAGSSLTVSNGNSFEADTLRLRMKLYKRGLCHTTAAYSLLKDGAIAKTGWQGVSPPKINREEIRRAHIKGTLGPYLEKFYPVYADLNRPALLFDGDNRLFAYRTAQFAWMQEECDAFHEANNKLMLSTLSSPTMKKKYAKGERGPHFPCIIGHHRQYMKVPSLTAWHKEHSNAVDVYINTPIVQKFIKCASSVVKLMFPGVAKRFNASAEWHKKHHNIAPLFGLFFNLCINGIFYEEPRIYCLPHADSKNIVGVCLLAIYQVPGKQFNHSKRCWLVLWEAGVIIELPPWTMLAYPSALIFHFNIDVKDFVFVTTDGDARPTPDNSMPILPGDEEGRGSLVFFNQSTMFRDSELNGLSVAEALLAGKQSTVDIGESIQEALMTKGQFYQMVPFNPER